LTATEAARQAISKLGLNGSTGVSVVNYADKRCSTVKLGTSAFAALTYFKNSSSTYVLLEIIVKPPTLIGGQQNQCFKRNAFRKADLMISCNFDFPVETDAKPSRKAAIRTTAIATKRQSAFQF
jgi:hypothetical protein